MAEAVAIRSAMRSLAIVLPLTIWFLFSASSAGYVIVMVKVATMGQQAEVERSRAMGASLIKSTVIGGITAIILIAPAVLDSAGGGTASAGFYSRLILVFFAAVYGTVAAKVFDAFWTESRRPPARASVHP